MNHLVFVTFPVHYTIREMLHFYASARLQLFESKKLDPVIVVYVLHIRIYNKNIIL